MSDTAFNPEALQGPDSTKANADYLSQAVPFVAGAANSLLFGAPELAIKALGGEKVKKIVEDYKAKNASYGAGELAGTVGSMFIPGGAILKGAGALAKGIGAEKLATGLGKAAQVASGPMGVKQGLVAAAEQAVPRAVVEQGETGDLGQTAAHLGTNLALGAGAGAVLGGAKKLLGYAPKRIGEEIDEAANDQFLSQVFGKTLGRGIRQVVGNKAGGASQIDKIDDLKSQMVDILNKNNIKNSQQVEDLLGENGKAWQKIGENVNEAIGFGKMSSLADLPDDMLTHPDIVDTINMYGSKAEGYIEDIANQVGKSASDPANTFAKTREILNRNINLGFKGGSEETIRGDVATAMKNYFDEMAMKIAPDADTDIKALKEVYPSFLAMGKAIARDKAVVAPAFTPGSDTYARFVSTVSDLGGAPQAVAGSVIGQALNKGATTAANILGSEGALAVKKLLPRAPSGRPLELSDIPANVQEGLKVAGKSAGTAAERSGLLQTVPQPPADQVPLMDKAPNPNFDPTNEETATQPPEADPLQSALEDVWKIEDPTGQVEAGSPESKQQFLDHMRQQLLNPDGSINYLRAAKVLTRGNAEDEKNLKESFVALQKIKGALPNAVRLLTIGDTKASTDKALVIGTVSDILKKGGVDAKDANKVVSDILGNPLKNPKEKAELIYDLLQKFNPTAFGEGGILHRAGVLT